MTATRDPLEKQLLVMNLTGGIDETASPLVGSNQSSLITKLDNMVQKQQGQWSHRSGLTRIDNNSDDLGNTIGKHLAAVRTTDGFGVVGEKGNFYHYSEAASSLRSRKGHVSEFSVSGNLVASTSVVGQDGNNGQRISCSASNSKYDVVVYEGGKVSIHRSVVMVVFDREAGMEVARYDLSLCGITVTSGKTLNCRAVFLADRYLQVFVQDTNVASADCPIDLVAWDTSQPWPDDITGLTHVANITGQGNVKGIVDVAWFNNRTLLLTREYVLSVNSANTLIELQDLTSYLVPSSFDVDSNGKVCIIGQDSGTNAVRHQTYSYGALTVIIDDHTDGVLTGFDLHIAVDESGHIHAVKYLTDPDTIYYKASIGADFTLQASLYDWNHLSHPFYSSETDKVYVHSCKYDNVNKLSAHVVICLSDVQTVLWEYSSDSTDVARCAVVLEPYNAIQIKLPVNSQQDMYTLGAAVLQRYIPRSDDDDEWMIPVPWQTATRTCAIASLSLKIHDPDSYGHANFGNNAYIGGGVISQYDGWRPHEAGFVDMPAFTLTDHGSGGSGPNGSYNYVAVYRHVDANGALTWSRTYGPVAITVANHDVDILVQGSHVNNKETGVTGDQQVIVDVYRTKTGATQYFLVASSQINLSSSTFPNTKQLVYGAGTGWAVKDSMSDTTLGSQPLMFRQPGTANSPLDRYPFQASKVVCQHKDRIFTVDPYGQRVYYSSFFVDGETAWTNPLFSFFVHGGAGPITALASMDGRLFVFKKDAVFAVDGDGPTEDGGNGTEFSPPQRLAVEFGSISRHLVVTPNGIVYRSTRGFELLSRSLQNQFIGARVKETASSYPYTLGSVLEANSEAARARFLIGDGSHSKEMVYDLVYDCWSTSSFETTDMVGAVGSADLSSVGETLVYLAERASFYLNPASGLDEGVYVPWTVETGFIRPTGNQGRHLFHKALVLGKKQEDHKLTMSLAVDYSDSYVKSQSFEPSVLNTTVEEVSISSPKLSPLSFRFKLEGASPTDTVTYPVTTGKGADLLDISFEIAPKKGGYDIAATRKS